MTSSYKESFFTILLLAFLLPLFFIPAGVIDIFNAKALIATLGLVVAGLLYLYSTWRQGEFEFKNHHLMTAVLALPLVYLLSALLTTPTSMSLFGYNLEVGTFGSILLGASLVLLVSNIITDSSRALRLVLSIFCSLAILSLFALVKILSEGEWLVWGNFGGNMGNPLGAWTDLAIGMGLLSIITTLAIGMLPMKGGFKLMAYIIWALSTFLVVIIGFSTAFLIMFVASILLFLYFRNVETQFLFDKESEKASFWKQPVVLPLIMAIISLIFLINPNISEERTLSNSVSSTFGISNTEVRPTLSTTLGISKAVLSNGILLGSGPNSFSRDWLVYKPTDINLTPFWSVEFPFGAGFIPTQISSTGLVGTLVWFAFFVLLFWLAYRSLGAVPESRGQRFALLVTIFGTLIIWLGALLYTPSFVLLMLGFVLVGLLLALAHLNGLVPKKTLSLINPLNRPIAILTMVLMAVGLLSLGWLVMERSVASYHFVRAANLSNVEGSTIEEVEMALLKATQFAPLDVYYRSVSELNFSKAQAIATSATGTPEVLRENFEQSIARSLDAARAAVGANPRGYSNWVLLGSIYSSLVPEPLKIEGAYENALSAFGEAYRTNPNNPEVPLLLAQLEINNKKPDQARSYIRSAINLKQDYTNAYALLVRLEISEENIKGAIASAEAVAAINPNNAGVHFELGLLKYSDSNFEGALASFKKAQELAPDYANAKYYEALSLISLGQESEALAILNELLLDNPDNTELIKTIESLNGEQAN